MAGAGASMDGVAVGAQHLAPVLALPSLTVRIRLGELCVWHVETLLISRRVNAGKFCYSMTLLSYLLPVKWRKYQYATLINEFLANFFYCTYPIENAV